jgi:hypothetical protein
MINPFHGLTPFVEGEELFERDADVERILGHFWASQVTVLFSASGVGKTSFLNAKLVPALRTMFGDSAVLISDSWARQKRPDMALSRLKDILIPQEGTSVLILDQFEEIFQSFPNKNLFEQVGSQLSQILGKQPRKRLSTSVIQERQATAKQTRVPVDVRLLISIREEFLADLSMFDGVVPALFSNYYRLEQFSLSQAVSIIKRTALTQGADVDKSGLAKLVQDLRTRAGSYVRDNESEIPPEVSVADSANASIVPDHPRDRTLGVIEAPFLQIACKRLWERERPAEDCPFLRTYFSGEAQQQLNNYCRSVLDGFWLRNRRALSRILPSLTGPREAKRAARLTELAREYRGLSAKRLKSVLDTLSARGVRILRHWSETRSGDGGTPDDVYELYHDMYSPLLWKWKVEQDREFQRVKLVMAIVIAGLFGFFVAWPLFSWITILNAVNHPHGGSDEILDVMSARNVLAQTLIWKIEGDHFWQQYNDRVAEQRALSGDIDGFFLHKLAAHGMGVESRRGDVSPLESTLSESVQYLQGSFDTTERYLSDIVFFSSEPAADRKHIIVGATKAGNVISWDGGRQPVPVNLPSGLAFDTFTVISFSPDGGEALVAWKPGSPEDIAVGTVEVKATSPNGPSTQTGSVNQSTTGAVTPQLELGTPKLSFDRKQNGPDTIIRIRGAFSSDGSMVAVAFDGVLLSWKNGTVGKPVEFRNLCGAPTIDVGFSKNNPNEIAFSYGDGNSYSHGVGRITENLTNRSPYCYDKRTVALPGGSRLVFRRSDNALLLQAVNTNPTSFAKWVWLGTSRAQPKDDTVILPAVDLPQAYRDSNNVLLSENRSGRLGLSQSMGQKTLYMTPALSSPRGGGSLFQTRVMTAASLAHFEKDGDVLSFDPDDFTVRRWALPFSHNVGGQLRELDVSMLNRAQASNPRNACPTKVDNLLADNKSVEDELKQLKGLCYQSSGNRAVVLSQASSVFYLSFSDSSRGSVNKVTPLELHDAIHGMAFGPGSDAVTLLSASSVSIYRPDGPSGSKPEWFRRQVSLSLLQIADDSAVILVAADKGILHRLEQEPPTFDWEHPLQSAREKLFSSARRYKLTSVLVDEPIELDEGGKLSDLHLLNRIDFKREQNIWHEFDMQNNSGEKLEDCGHSSSQSKAPADARAHVGQEAQSPTSALCIWEERSGRLLEDPAID